MGAVRKAGRAIDKGIDKVTRAVDPRTEEGWKNILTGGAYGITKELADRAGLTKDDEPGITDSEKEAARVASKEFEFANEMEFVKDEYANRIERLGSHPMQDYVVGKSNVNSQNLSKGLNDKSMASLNQSGVDPSSGRGVATTNQASNISATESGETRGESQFALDSSYLQGRSNRVAMAMGEKTQAVNGLQDIANRATRESIDDANRSFNESKANAEAIGSAAGFAYSQGNRGGDEE